MFVSKEKKRIVQIRFFALDRKTNKILLAFLE